MSSFFAYLHFLRRVLWSDSASGAGTALLQWEFADTLAPMLGLPADLLLWSGAGLGAFVLFIAWIASRRTKPAGPVWLLVAQTMLGIAFLIVQVVFVGVLAELKWIGVRKFSLRLPGNAWYCVVPDSALSEKRRSTGR